MARSTVDKSGVKEARLIDATYEEVIARKTPKLEQNLSRTMEFIGNAKITEKKGSNWIQTGNVLSKINNP